SIQNTGVTGKVLHLNTLDSSLRRSATCDGRRSRRRAAAKPLSTANLSLFLLYEIDQNSRDIRTKVLCVVECCNLSRKPCLRGLDRVAGLSTVERSRFLRFAAERQSEGWPVEFQ